jgi:hypothetical protein
MTRLRTSANRCEEYGAMAGALRRFHSTTAVSPAALRRARNRRIRSAAGTARPVGGRPRCTGREFVFWLIINRNSLRLIMQTPISAQTHHITHLPSPARKATLSKPLRAPQSELLPSARDVKTTEPAICANCSPTFELPPTMRSPATREPLMDSRVRRVAVPENAMQGASRRPIARTMGKVRNAAVRFQARNPRRDRAVFAPDLDARPSSAFGTFPASLSSAKIAYGRAHAGVHQRFLNSRSRRKGLASSSLHSSPLSARAWPRPFP